MRRGKRHGQRGVAMVEGAVVISVLVVFFGVIAGAYASAKAKLSAQHDARVAVVYRASHACKAGLDAASSTERAGEGLPVPSGDGTGMADRALGGGMEERTSFEMTESKVVASSQLVGRTRTHDSTSWAVCNESPEDGDARGLFGYAFGKFEGLMPRGLGGRR